MILTWLLGGGKWAESPGCTPAYAQLAKNWLLGGDKGRSPLTARLPMPHSLKIGCLLGTKPPGPTHADAPLAKNWLLGGDKGAESPGCKHPSKNPRSHMTGSQWPKPQKILHRATLVLPDIKAS